MVASEKAIQEKRKQLLTANKIAARSLLLGISFASSEQIVTQKRDE